MHGRTPRGADTASTHQHSESPIQEVTVARLDRAITANVMMTAMGPMEVLQALQNLPMVVSEPNDAKDERKQDDRIACD